MNTHHTLPIDKLIHLIESAFETINLLKPDTASHELKAAINETISLLDSGIIRVAEKINGQWLTYEWIKKAVLLYFRLNKNEIMNGGFTRFYDKVPLKFAQSTEEDFLHGNARIVPPATIRFGSYIAANTIIMPAFINIGANIGEGTMIDTWATVGSCAQIGKNVHISGGAGIGGVLEPLQANPTIIEDNCFIGARSEIVEGVVVEEGSVISMGVFIGQSTRIYHRETGKISYGRIPAGSVVVSGSLPASGGKYNLYCAIIVKQVDSKTLTKVQLNELLREAD